MTILVTGSAGHLGEALMQTLRTNGHAVRGIDIRPSSYTDDVGSIADRGFVRSIMAGIRTVLHTATLHKPHLATHSDRDFVDTNLTGTLNLLEESVSQEVDRFVFTSTTSTFGSVLTPEPGDPAVWVTEEVAPVPKNIYGVTKVAAEGLCEIFHRRHGLSIIVLRVSRFFPEADRDDTKQRGYSSENVLANELLYRRVDIADVVSAHLLAAQKARRIGFRRYIISATTPFDSTDLFSLRQNAAGVVQRLFPDCASLYARHGWKLFPDIGRVYVNRLAVEQLGWKPIYDFRHVLDCLRTGRDFRSRSETDIDAEDEMFTEGSRPIA
ncbi:MAG: NAD(P)-dependent oxidoreductase [Rhizobiaceae bacterium]|nr:NAD(P)-dependent oxidoreductase [Rhizobiaceae bacterium]